MVCPAPQAAASAVGFVPRFPLSYYESLGVTHDQRDRPSGSVPPPPRARRVRRVGPRVRPTKIGTHAQRYAQYAAILVEWEQSKTGESILAICRNNQLLQNTVFQWIKRSGRGWRLTRRRAGMADGQRWNWPKDRTA